MQKVLLVAVAILFALGVLTSYQKHILDYRVSAITETEFGQASAIEHREYLLRSCQSGVWSGAGKMRVQTVNGASSCTNKGTMIASCPTGTFVVSGSYALTAWGKNSNHNSPDAMYTDPDNNRFVIVAPNNNSTTCFRAIATCASLQ